MPILLTIQGNTYEYPVPNEDPNWSGDATDWAEAVTDALSTLLGTGDILNSSVNISNNASSATDITGLIFDPGQVRAANITFSVYRESDSTTSGYSETGTIYITYDNNAATNSKWILNKVGVGDSGMNFTILDTGQVQYTSNDIGSAGYSGVMKFSAKSLAQ